jgi:hypothetical protein
MWSFISRSLFKSYLSMIPLINWVFFWIHAQLSSELPWILINSRPYFNWALVQWIPMSLIIITVLRLLIWVTKLSQLWCTFRPVVVRFVLHYQIQILYGIIALESPSHIPYWLVRRVYDLYNSGLSIVIIHSASILR